MRPKVQSLTSVQHEITNHEQLGIRFSKFFFFSFMITNHKFEWECRMHIFQLVPWFFFSILSTFQIKRVEKNNLTADIKFLIMVQVLIRPVCWWNYFVCLYDSLGFWCVAKRPNEVVLPFPVHLIYVHPVLVAELTFNSFSTTYRFWWN